MGFEADIPGLRQTDGINQRKRTFAVAHQDPLANGVDAHIVGIVTELDAPDRG